jgi:hypothetical protein
MMYFQGNNAKEQCTGDLPFSYTVKKHHINLDLIAAKLSEWSTKKKLQKRTMKGRVEQRDRTRH